MSRVTFKLPQQHNIPVIVTVSAEAVCRLRLLVSELMCMAVKLANSCSSALCRCSPASASVYKAEMVSLPKLKPITEPKYVCYVPLFIRKNNLG